jgi:trimeric autotransporter adhesin
MYSLLKQNTAATITIGPVLNADGTAYVTDNLTYGNFLVGKGGTWAAMVSTATIAHVTGDLQGNFKVTFTGSGTPNDLDTIGRLEISLNKATLAAPIYRGTVLAAATFDALITNAAGAANGLLIAGNNAATTFAALTVTTTTTLTGNVSLGGTLIISGAVTLSSTLAAGGVTFASMAVTGALSVGTTTTLTGNVLLSGTLVVTGTTTHTGAVTLTGGITTGTITGTINANMTQINSTSIAGTSTQIAAAFVEFFNVANPVLTVASVNQTAGTTKRGDTIQSGVITAFE